MKTLAISSGIRWCEVLYCMFDNIRTVKEFERIINYKKEGTPVKLYVAAVVDDKNVYQKNTICYISYDVRYMQYSIAIEWNTSDEVMKDLGLHAAYNTNFQTMKIEQNALIIIGNNYRIQLQEE